MLNLPTHFDFVTPGASPDFLEIGIRTAEPFDFIRNAKTGLATLQSEFDFEAVADAPNAVGWLASLSAVLYPLPCQLRAGMVAVEVAPIDQTDGFFVSPAGLVIRWRTASPFEVLEYVGFALAHGLANAAALPPAEAEAVFCLAAALCPSAKQSHPVLDALNADRVEAASAQIVAGVIPSRLSEIYRDFRRSVMLNEIELRRIYPGMAGSSIPAELAEIEADNMAEIEAEKNEG